MNNLTKDGKYMERAISKKIKTYNPEKIHGRAGWFFVFPFLAVFLVFTVYPMMDSFYLTFHKMEGYNISFAGLANYKQLINDELFWRSLGNTFLYLIIQVPVMLLLALILSIVVNSPKLRFRGAFRTMFFIPCVTSLVAYSIIFKMMFSSDGIINMSMQWMHIIQAPIQWLREPIAAKVLIIIALVWRWTGYNMMFFLSYLQNINKEYFEAADIDGANILQKFKHITMPLMKPILLFSAIMSTIGTLQLFDETFNITKGDPNYSTISISHYIYNQSFVYAPNFAYSATLSYVVVLILVVLSIIEFRVMGDEK